MPARNMPPLGAVFARQCDLALNLARAGEIARAASPPGSIAYQQLYPARLETLYEAAYLRVFISWELFLEESFLRFLCGYSSPTGGQVPIPV